MAKSTFIMAVILGLILTPVTASSETANNRASQWLSDRLTGNLVADRSAEEWARVPSTRLSREFARVALASQRSGSVSGFREREGALVKMIGLAYPAMSAYWNESVTIAGRRYIQSDALINPSRQSIYQVNQLLGDYESTLEANQSKAQGYDRSHSSRSLMEQGWPAIGPDNRVIRVCRLIDDDRASYFELAHRDAWRLLEAIASPMSSDQACLQANQLNHYWQQRIDDLIDERGRVNAHRRNSINRYGDRNFHKRN